MLVPVQPAGTQPPLFFIHGRPGIMPIGPIFAGGLGSDQPLYVIHANGLDGQAPILESVREMALAYADEIQRARPSGPVVVGGMCDGTLIAVEVARELGKRGRRVGPVILAAPTFMPPGFIRENQTVDPKHPMVAGQLFQQATRSILDHVKYPYNEIPFDANDPKQMRAATLTGVACLVAYSRHVPAPFPGPAQLILPARRAVGFFHPNLPWYKLLSGPRMVHVVPWEHMDMFRAGRDTVARLIKLFLEEGPALEALVPRQAQRASA
jgi:thioesterase domain-containing protein